MGTQGLPYHISAPQQQLKGAKTANTGNITALPSLAVIVAFATFVASSQRSKPG